MRKLLGLLALGLIFSMADGSTASAQTTTTPPLTVTNGTGIQGNSSSWMTFLALPRVSFGDLFSPFRIMSTPGYNTNTYINTENPNVYLKQFGFTRPVKR